MVPLPSGAEATASWSTVEGTLRVRCSYFDKSTVHSEAAAYPQVPSMVPQLAVASAAVVAQEIFVGASRGQNGILRGQKIQKFAENG